MLSKTDLYFLTIAKTGNLSQAAQQLYVSQPSLSKYIQRLESRLNSPLFDHSSSPLKLNESGQLYLEYLLDALEKEQQLLNQIGEINQSIRGTLRLGIPSFCGQCYLPKVLPAFSAEFPFVSIDLHENTGAVLERELENQVIDLAVLHSPISSPKLAYQTLKKERILLVKKRSSSTPSAITQKKIVVQEGSYAYLEGHPVIMPEDEQKLGRLVNDFFSQINYQPKVFIKTQNVATTLALASVDMGIGFIPESGLETISKDILDQLDFYSFSQYLSNWQLVSVNRKGTMMSVFVKRFLELLVSLSSHTGS